MNVAPNDQSLLSRRKIKALLTVTVVIIGAIALLQPTGSPDAKRTASNANTANARGDVTPVFGRNSVEQVAPTLAVFPFSDQSKLSGNAYLASGIAAELIEHLTQDASVLVTTRPFSLNSDPVNLIPGSAMSEFNVDAVLQGTTSKSADQITVALQLTDARSGQQLWVKEYQRDFSEIFAMTNEITRAIVQTLLGKPNGEGAQAKRSTTHVQAYQQFLQGRHYFYERGEDLLKARAALEVAIQLDPQFVNAWAYLAATLLLTPDYIQDGTLLNTRSALHQKARETANQAVKLDNTSALAHAVLGKLASAAYQWEVAEKLLSKAVALDPYNALSRQWRGDLYLNVGHAEKARNDYTVATKIDPLHAAYHEKLGYTLLATANYKAAEVSIQKALEMRKQTALLPLAFLRMSTGERTKARELMEQYVELLGYSREGKAIALYLESIDGADRGQELYQAIKNGMESGRKFPNFVILLATLGRYDEALEHAQMQNLETVPGLPANLWLTGVRGIVQRPAFLALAERLGFTTYWRASGYPDNCQFVSLKAPHLQCDY